MQFCLAGDWVPVKMRHLLRKPGRLQVTSKLALAPGWPPALQPPDRLPLAALRADTSLRESNRFRDGCSKLPPGMQPLGPAGTIFPHRLTAPRASLCNPAAAPLPLALSSSSVGMRGGGACSWECTTCGSGPQLAHRSALWFS